MKGNDNVIDVAKELQKYNIKDVEIDFSDDIAGLLSIFNKTVERIGKEQYKSLRNIDEILELLDATKENEELIKSFKEKAKLTEKENENLIKALVEVADLFEDIYMYSEKSLNEGFAEQMKLQLSNMEQVLLTYGLTRFGDVGEAFNSQLHIPKEVRENEGFMQVQILEIIKSGYTYKGQIIRKAEVVINNI